MKIDTSTIEGYSEMTAEQKLSALESFDYNDKTAELEKMKASLSKANSEAAEWKRKHNALLDDDAKKKQQDEDEREAFAAELENVKAENQALLKEIKTSKYTAKYLSLGYDEKLASDSAAAMSSLSDEDANKIFENIGKYNTMFEAKIKEELMNNMTRPTGGIVDRNNLNPHLEQAKAIGKEKADADKRSADILSYYLKT